MTGDEIKRILVHHKVIPVTAMLIIQLKTNLSI